MTVEKQVRSTLTDERHALPGWPDPVDRVSAGIRRRRRRRTMTTAALTVVFAVALGVPAALGWGGGAAPTDEMPADGVLPWIAAPAPEPARFARREPRPDARPCTLADLGVEPNSRQPLAWVEKGESDDDYQRLNVLLPNKKDSRCTLRGSVDLVATDVATGRRGPVATWLDPPKANAVNQYPATIDPGEPARVDLVLSTTPCGYGTPNPRHYRDVAVVTLGHEFAVSEFELTTECPVGLGSWYALPPLLNVPYQVASIEAPRQVRRGETLEYEVSILNSSPRPFALRPCPVYTQRLGAEATTHRLNCAVRTIPAHRSVRFRMSLAVPETMPLGKARLTWTAVMDDGRVMIADLATGGVYIEVTG